MQTKVLFLRDLFPMGNNFIRIETTEPQQAASAIPVKNLSNKKNKNILSNN